MNRLPCISLPVLGDILISSYFDPLSTSRLCRPEDRPSDTDELAALYADELNSLLYRLLPLRHFVRRQRPSDPWFDKKCRNAKRSTRRLERAYAAANRRAAVATSGCSTAARLDATTAVAMAAAAKAAWYNQRQLRHQNCTDFWRGKLEANSSNPHQLWRLVDDLLRRGRVPESSAIDFEAFSQFFAQKVASIKYQRRAAGVVQPCATWRVLAVFLAADD